MASERDWGKKCMNKRTGATKTGEKQKPEKGLGEEARRSES
jgi:hypothetical protein